MSASLIGRGFAAPRDRRHAAMTVGALGIGIALLVIGFVVLRAASSGPEYPADGSVEVGFVRDMSVHHAQAVEMAELIREQTRDPDVRQLAVDIALTQQAQIGQMRGWLDVWGRSPSGAGPRMAWMHEAVDGPMPGMASPADINRLRGLRGRPADELFLTLMLEHHRTGVTMAEAAIERTDLTIVERFATAVATAQASEQDVMRRMLEDIRQATPPPGPDAGRDHGGGEH